MMQKNIDGPSKGQLLEIVNSERSILRFELVQKLHAEGAEMTEDETHTIDLMLSDCEEITDQIKQLKREHSGIMRNIATVSDKKRFILAANNLLDTNKRGVDGFISGYALHKDLVEFDKETNNMLRDVCHL